MNAAHRRQFREHAIRLGLADYYVSRFTRLASTHDRLSEAACNGDWPCDNGERKVIFCDRCQGGMVRSKIVKGLCECCRVEDRLTTLGVEAGVSVDLQGDPRGWTVTLKALPEPKRTGGLCAPGDTHTLSGQRIQ